MACGNHELWDKAILEEWLKDRDDAALSFDIGKMKAYMHKYGYDAAGYIPSDEVLEITMRKMVVNMEHPPESKRKEAEEWLLSRGYDLLLQPKEN